MTPSSGYELIDFGDGERLERFGERLVIRPHAGAIGDRRRPADWHGADLHYDRTSGWSGPGADVSPWTMDAAGVRLELRPTGTGQVGLFPEQLGMLPWINEVLAGSRAPATLLNLFGYTGVATLAAARLGASVTHVDASRPTMSWARRNAELSSLSGAPIRWIVDDAATFVAREARRGRQYDGVVLDPPTYGHGPGGRDWRLVRDLDALITTIRGVLAPDAFALVTSHTPDLGPVDLARRLADGLDRPQKVIDRGELAVETNDGRHLVLGTFARFRSGA